MPTPSPPPSNTSAAAAGDPHVSYMTKEQLSTYLADLRSNRPARPAGSRPLPPSSYQQKRAAAAAAVGTTSTSPTKTSPVTNSNSPEQRRRDSHRRTRTNPVVSFASTTTEYPAEPQTPVLSGLENDVGNLDISGGMGHRKTKSTASIDSQSTIEQLRATTPPVAPLRINKANSSQNNSTPVRNPSNAPLRNGFVSSPSRHVYNHPNQFSKPQYTTNPVPLPSPPPEVEEEGRGIGTREERGRPPVPMIKIQREKPKEPPVIAIVDAPVENMGRGGGGSAGAPSINISGPPAIPAIVFPDGEDEWGKKNVPAINVPGISISVEDTSVPAPAPPRTPTPSTYSQPQQQQSRRPLPTPNASPFRKTPSTYSTTGRPSAACTTCYQHISGRIVSALGSRFHPECFRCYHCREKLEHVGFFPEPEKNRGARAEAAGARVNEMDKRFYCHLDYHELFSPRCKQCQTPIEGEVVVACGETWHVGHFFCAECGDPFTADTRFVEKDKYAWCLPCYNKRYSSKCRKCKKPVTDTVVKAMGGEWHVECFCCAIGEKAMRKCFGPHNSSSGPSSSTLATPSLSSPTPNAAEDHATKVTKPKERGLRKARSVIGLALRRPSVDSGYGGDIEKSAIPVVADGAAKKEVAVSMSASTSTSSSNPSTPKKDNLGIPNRLTASLPRPASATGSLLRRIKSTRLPFRSASIPTAASVFANSPPPQLPMPILEGPSEKEMGYSANSLPSRLGTPVPPVPPVPPLMMKLVEGLLVERRPMH